VEITRRPRIADPDFEASPGAPPVRLRDFDPLEYQRLVVNPFLAVFGLVVVVRVGAWLAETRYPALAMLAVVPLAFLPLLIQYHCLDCGQTGSYVHRDRHACPAVGARWNHGSRSRARFPSGWAQLVVWGWILGSLGLLLAVHAWN